MLNQHLAAPPPLSSPSPTHQKMAASGSQQSCPLLQLPYDVFLDCLLPFIPTADLVRLRQACKMLQQWTDNDFIWRRRIQGG